MERCSFKELWPYVKELKNNGKNSYPAFAIKFNGDWLILLADKIFECEERYAKIADFFLGRYYVSDRLPPEFQKIIDCLPLVDRTANEKSITKELHTLLVDSGIPCKYSLNSGADLTIYNGFYLCELKKVLPKNILTCIGQPVMYLHSYANSDSCLLLETQTGRYYNVVKILPERKELFRYGMYLDRIDPVLIELALRNNICKYCPRYQVESGGYYSLCDCPVNTILNWVYEKGFVKSLAFEWASGFLEPSDGNWKVTRRTLSDEEVKAIIDNS